MFGQKLSTCRDLIWRSAWSCGGCLTVFSSVKFLQLSNFMLQLLGISSATVQSITCLHTSIFAYYNFAYIYPDPCEWDLTVPFKESVCSYKSVDLSTNLFESGSGISQQLVSGAYAQQAKGSKTTPYFVLYLNQISIQDSSCWCCVGTWFFILLPHTGIDVHIDQPVWCWTWR